MPINSGRLIDGVGAEISRLLQTVWENGRGILVHSWRSLNECESCITLQRYSCCMLEFCSVLVSESCGKGGVSPFLCVKYESSMSLSQDSSIIHPICWPTEGVSYTDLILTRSAPNSYLVYPLMYTTLQRFFFFMNPLLVWVLKT